MYKSFKSMAFPILLLIAAASLGVYITIDESNFNNDLIDKALKGNPNAVKILIKYKEPKKLPRRVVSAALEGNPYAIEALQLNDE